MSNKGIPLSRMMKFTALIALNLTIVRSLPFIPQSPPLLFVLVMLDIVLVQAVILGRPLHVFHYTFLIVGLVASFAITVLAFLPPTSGKTGSLRILETLIGSYEAIAGKLSKNYEFHHNLEIAERCVTSTLGPLIAWAAGLVVARQLKRRPPQPGSFLRHVGSFIQGAVIGLGVLTPIAYAIDSWVHQPGASHKHTRSALWSGLAYLPSLGSYARWLGLACLPLLGGFVVMSLNHRQNPDRAAVQEAPDPSEISAS